ncbi:hypothetical protein OO015_01735 [Thermomicrobium sp. 4228-Ro]|uniref:hypothetical protein n=1 Tax=Thermomicrobium sp. 4228-Ro TaxID=2993937 RepID=UPI0022492790|nr:hypothetical protein [Thermomicrobium sp. 4228-Ro]MCX2726216.1 hypothetical protein [Thermomicrobium sp. 4228-Ro]
MKDEDELVRLALAPNELVAALWRGALEAEGIPVLVKILGLGAAYWSTLAAEHALYVRASDVARAAAVLASLEDSRNGES